MSQIFDTSNLTDEQKIALSEQLKSELPPVESAADREIKDLEKELFSITNEPIAGFNDNHLNRRIMIKQRIYDLQRQARRA